MKFILLILLVTQFLHECDATRSLIEKNNNSLSQKLEWVDGISYELVDDEVDSYVFFAYQSNRVKAFAIALTSQIANIVSAVFSFNIRAPPTLLF